jgi:hypothetical protein
MDLEQCGCFFGVQDTFKGDCGRFCQGGVKIDHKGGVKGNHSEGAKPCHRRGESLPAAEGECSVRGGCATMGVFS